MQENINLLDYDYEDNQMITIEIPGKLLETTISMFDTIQKMETHYGISDTYPKTVKEVHGKDSDGKKYLKKVEQELVQYPTMESYATQPFQVFKTQLGAVAFESLMNFKEIHLDNIRKGIAKQKASGEFKLEPNA